MTIPRKSRNPWPIAIVAYFVLFSSFTVALIVFATGQRVDLVRNDYYEEEIRYQTQLERIQRTQQNGQAAAVAYDPGEQCIMVRLPAAHALQTSGRIHLYRPSDAALDEDVALALNGDGTQRVDAKRLRAGLWKVRVLWELDGKEYYSDQPVVVRSQPAL
jgi:hypothetical protein